MRNPWLSHLHTALVFMALLQLLTAQAWIGRAQRAVSSILYLETVRMSTREYDFATEEKMTVEAFVSGVAELAAHGSPLRLRSDQALRLIPMLTDVKRAFSGDTVAASTVEEVFSTLDEQQMTAIQQSWVSSSTLPRDKVFPTFEASVRENAVNDGRDLAVPGMADAQPAGSAGPGAGPDKGPPPPGGPPPDRGADRDAGTSTSEIHATQGRDELPGNRLKRLRRAVQLNPQDIESRQELAMALTESGDLEAGVREYRVALQAAPQDSNLRSDLARLLFRLGRLDEATAEIRASTALQAPPDKLRALLKVRAGSKLILVEGSPGQHLAMAAGLVGTQGKVYALSDVVVDVGFLNGLAGSLGLPQAEVLQVTPTSCKLPASSVDAVYLDNYVGRFFGVVGSVDSAGQEFVDSLVAAVRPGGRIVFTEGSHTFEELAVRYFKRARVEHLEGVRTALESVLWSCEVPVR